MIAQQIGNWLYFILGNSRMHSLTLLQLIRSFGIVFKITFCFHLSRYFRIFCSGNINRNWRISAEFSGSMWPCTIPFFVKMYSLHHFEQQQTQRIHKYALNWRTAESKKLNNNYFTANRMRSQPVSYKSSSLRVITTFISKNNAQLSIEKCFSVEFIAICFGSSTFSSIAKCEISEERDIQTRAVQNISFVL